MVTIGELATTHPVSVLTTTRVDDAARFMAELGIGDVIVTDPEHGRVVGMLTDRDVTVRLVAKNLDGPSTEVGSICTLDVTTVNDHDDVATAAQLMTRDAVRRLPVVDDDGKPIGIVSIEDMAGSGDITDDSLRQVMRALADSYRQKRLLH